MAAIDDFNQARADYKAYATELKSQRDAAVQVAEDAVARLEATVAGDAAEDEAQLAGYATSLRSDLDDVKGRPDPVEPEVPAGGEPAPAEPSTPFPSGPSGDTDPVIPPVPSE